MKRLIALDQGGVIWKSRNIWMEAHKLFGTLDQGKVFTDSYLYTNYKRLVEKVVMGLWYGKDITPFLELIDSAEYNPGVKEFFEVAHNEKWGLAIISASDMRLAARVDNDFGLDAFVANQLLEKDGNVAGFSYPIGAGGDTKAAELELLKYKYLAREVIYIGDTSDDIEACISADLSIAFNPKNKELLSVVDYVVESDNLSDILSFI